MARDAMPFAKTSSMTRTDLDLPGHTPAELRAANIPR